MEVQFAEQASSLGPFFLPVECIGTGLAREKTPDRQNAPVIRF